MKLYIWEQERLVVSRLLQMAFKHTKQYSLLLENLLLITWKTSELLSFYKKIKVSVAIFCLFLLSIG